MTDDAYKTNTEVIVIKKAQKRRDGLLRDIKEDLSVFKKREGEATYTSGCGIYGY